MNNPINYSDANGLDVYVTGKQSKQVVEELNNNTNLTIKVDDNGKLSATGKPENQMEFMLLQAINSKEINVNLVTTNENAITMNGEINTFQVDMYAGSEITENGTIEATQYININHAKVWNEAGGSDIGGTIMHAVNEAFLGGALNPGKNIANTTKEELNILYLQSHNIIKDVMEEKQFYPVVVRTKDMKKVWLQDETGNWKDHPLYEIK